MNTSLQMTQMGLQRVSNQFLLGKGKNKSCDVQDVDEMWADGGIKNVRTEGLRIEKVSFDWISLSDATK